MTELSREEQITALATAMSTMPGLDGKRQNVPAPARRVWATELIDNWGVRIDPTKATAEWFATNQAWTGAAAAPMAMAAKATSATRGTQTGTRPDGTVTDEYAQMHGATQYVERMGPDFLAANNPTLAQRIAAAKTSAEKDALAAELRQQILNNPSTLVTDFVSLLT